MGGGFVSGDGARGNYLPIIPVNTYIIRTIRTPKWEAVNGLSTEFLVVDSFFKYSYTSICHFFSSMGVYL